MAISIVTAKAAEFNDLTAELSAELHAEITRWGDVYWCGTRAQLEAECGLIPPGLEWPNWRRAAEWETGGKTCRLERYKPPGFKGHVRDWNAIDYWHLTVRDPSAMDGWSIREAEQRVRRLKWLSTPEGRMHSAKLGRAVDAATADRQFQSFLIQAGARKAPAIRKSKEQ